MTKLTYFDTKHITEITSEDVLTSLRPSDSNCPVSLQEPVRIPDRAVDQRPSEPAAEQDRDLR